MNGNDQKYLKTTTFIKFEHYSLATSILKGSKNNGKHNFTMYSNHFINSRISQALSEKYWGKNTAT